MSQIRFPFINYKRIWHKDLSKSAKKITFEPEEKWQSFVKKTIVINTCGTMLSGKFTLKRITTVEHNFLPEQVMGDREIIEKIRSGVLQLVSENVYKEEKTEELLIEKIKVAKDETLNVSTLQNFLLEPGDYITFATYSEEFVCDVIVQQAVLCNSDIS